MTKNKAVSIINNFALKEEHELIKQDMNHEAFQIRAARNMMYYAIANTIKELVALLDEMTTYTQDKDGFMIYGTKFVHDEYTRNLVAELKKQFKH